jgi:hypothetical protein
MFLVLMEQPILQACIWNTKQALSSYIWLTSLRFVSETLQNPHFNPILLFAMQENILQKQKQIQKHLYKGCYN